MAIETRTQLKTYFQTGDKPTQAQFEDLIDSAVPVMKTLVGADDPYTLLNTDYTIFGECTANQINVALPPAASCPGRVLCFKKIDGSGNRLQLSPSGGESIEGIVGNYNEMDAQFESAIIQSDGVSNWWVIAKI